MPKLIIALVNFANARRKSIGRSNVHLSRDIIHSAVTCVIRAATELSALRSLLFTALLNCVKVCPCEEVVLYYVGSFVCLCVSSCDFCCVCVMPVL